MRNLRFPSLPFLPAELWWVVAGALPLRDRAALRAVCAGFRDFLDNPSLWQDAAAPPGGRPGGPPVPAEWARAAALKRASGRSLPAVKWVLAHFPPAPAPTYQTRYGMLEASCKAGNLGVARWVGRAFPLRGTRPLAATKLLHAACEGRNPRLLRWLWHALARWTVWAPREVGTGGPHGWAPFGALFCPERFCWCAPLADPLTSGGSEGPEAPHPPVPKGPGPDLLSRKLLASANLPSLREVFLSAARAGEPVARCAAGLFGEYLTARDVMPAVLEALRSGDRPLYSLLARAFLLSSWKLAPDSLPLLYSAGLAGGEESAAWVASYFQVAPGAARAPPLAPWRAYLEWLALGLRADRPDMPGPPAAPPAWGGRPAPDPPAADPEPAEALRPPYPE